MGTYDTIGGTPISPDDPGESHIDYILDDIDEERHRQIEQEGWTPDHDDKHDKGELSRAAACYAYSSFQLVNAEEAVLPTPLMWPFESWWWKPTTARRNLVKAAALIVAEIERIDRASAGRDS